MGLREVGQQVARLCWRLMVGTVDGLPEGNQTCESNGHAAVWDQESFERGIRTPGQFQEQVAASFAATQGRTDTPANKFFSATDVATVLGPNVSATITNVLVLGTENSTPLKRMEIRLEDPQNVSPTLTLLAVALQKSGVDFRLMRHPGIPATEIWLTSPLIGGKKTLLSCAATVNVQPAQGVAAEANSPRSQAQ